MLCAAETACRRGGNHNGEHDDRRTGETACQGILFHAATFAPSERAAPSNKATLGERTLAFLYVRSGTSEEPSMTSSARLDDMTNPLIPPVPWRLIRTRRRLPTPDPRCRLAAVPAADGCADRPSRISRSSRSTRRAFITESGKALSAFLEAVRSGRRAKGRDAQKRSRRRQSPSARSPSTGWPIRHGSPRRRPRSRRPFLQLWAQTYRRLQGEQADPGGAGRQGQALRRF